MNHADFLYALESLLRSDPAPTADRQPYYEMLHAWALRGMGYGIGDHPATSGERGVLEVLARRCERPVVFDVGANVGDWAAMACERFGDAAQIDCFEPSVTAFDKLAKRLAGRAHGFHLHGLSDREESAALHTDALGSGMASVYRRRLDHFGRSFGDSVPVMLRRLDDVCAELSVTRIDLLKLDVEGHELAVLRGAGDMLTSGAIRMIQWEMGGCNLDSRTSLQDFWYLLHEHFDIFRIVSDGLAPITQYREQLEVFMCSNFVAIWRER